MYKIYGGTAFMKKSLTSVPFEETGEQKAALDGVIEKYKGEKER